MTGKAVVLTGGVGGAKFVLGLGKVMAAASITAIVNIGDDFDHLGLRISPDIDTLLYTLSGKANRERGWGREDESWSFLAALTSLGGEDWFQLGDGDLALHVLRSEQLRRGQPLSAIVRDFARNWDIGVHILPMSDDPVGTHVLTDEGELPFQRYFVERRCEPQLRAVTFHGAATATSAPGVIDAILDPDNLAVFIAPSNPYLSIDPILAIPSLRAALAGSAAPVIAISPLVAGRAMKGPTAKIMHELGIAPTPAAIAAHYAGILDGMIYDERDAPCDIPVPVAVTDTLMTTDEDKARVARVALTFAGELRA